MGITGNPGSHSPISSPFPNPPLKWVSVQSGILKWNSHSPFFSHHCSLMMWSVSMRGRNSWRHTLHGVLCLPCVIISLHVAHAPWAPTFCKVVVKEQCACLASCHLADCPLLQTGGNLLGLSNIILSLPSAEVHLSSLSLNMLSKQCWLLIWKNLKLSLL